MNADCYLIVTLKVNKKDIASDQIDGQMPLGSVENT